MPTSFLSADAGFPRLTEEMPVEERMNRIENYLYMLLEQLRYTLANLGEENFNEAAFQEISQDIQEPVLSVVSDLAGNVSTISQTATAITTRLDNFNGSSSTIEQTATSLTTRLNDFNGSGSTIEQTATALNFAVFDPSGAVSQVTQTATSLTTRLDNFNGTSSTIEQTASAITTRLDDFDGSGSTIEQTVAGIEFDVYDSSGALSRVSQQADKIDWLVASGTSASDMTMTSEAIDVISQGINITGYVTFNSLETAGSSAINGNNIMLQSDSTGNSGSYLDFRNANDHTYGELWTLATSSADPNTYKDPVNLALHASGLVDSGYCGLLLSSGHNLVAEGSKVNMDATDEIALTCPNSIIIQGANPVYSRFPSGFYSFCSDGIYYGSQRIVAV